MKSIALRHAGGWLHVSSALIAALIAAALVAGCSTAPTEPSIEREPGAVSAPPPPRAAVQRPAAPPSTRGGYYKDDGPGDNPPPGLDRIADAEPRVEPLQRASNNPYNVFGAGYTPMKDFAPFRQTGIASWYGRRFHGLPTSSGEPYDMYAMTAAHPTLPIPSYARVTNARNQRSVIVRVNDRGPFHSERVIDLSFAAAYKLGYAEVGSAPVEVELLLPEEIARLSSEKALAGSTRLAAAPAGAGTGMQTPVGVPAAMTKAVAAVPGNLGREPDSSQLYVQIGAYSVRANAESLRERLRRDATWLSDAIEILQGGEPSGVQVGPYLDRDKASAVAARIQEALSLESLLVTCR